MSNIRSHESLRIVYVCTSFKTLLMSDLKKNVDVIVETFGLMGKLAENGWESIGVLSSFPVRWNKETFLWKTLEC